jgi:hypothetical protein
MLFNVKVVTREEFNQHIEKLRALGQVGELSTGRVVTSANTDCLGNPDLPGCKEG